MGLEGEQATERVSGSSSEIELLWKQGVVGRSLDSGVPTSCLIPPSYCEPVTLPPPPQRCSTCCPTCGRQPLDLVMTACSHYLVRFCQTPCTASTCSLALAANTQLLFAQQLFQEVSTTPTTTAMSQIAKCPTPQPFNAVKQRFSGPCVEQG